MRLTSNANWAMPLSFGINSTTYSTIQHVLGWFELFKSFSKLSTMTSAICVANILICSISFKTVRNLFAGVWQFALVWRWNFILHPFADDDDFLSPAKRLPALPARSKKSWIANGLGRMQTPVAKIDFTTSSTLWKFTFSFSMPSTIFVSEHILFRQRREFFRFPTNLTSSPDCRSRYFDQN